MPEKYKSDFNKSTQDIRALRAEARAQWLASINKRNTKRK